MVSIDNTIVECNIEDKYIDCNKFNNIAQTKAIETILIFSFLDL